MMDKYIGRLLDNRYEVMTAIGTGGMAVVYKALDHRLNRQVALKILKDDYSGDAEFRRRFHAESQAVAMLNHPNIVSVYDVSTDGDADYIVMELVDGITLKQYIERRGGYLNWKESLHFASQIAKALEHAHNQGVIHRDIKPHNVMILKNGSAKVTDFGIARMMSAQNTLTKEALGSVHYISPEQAKGGRVDNRSDIYSLGVVMYEMITGQPPYDGESPVAVALQHINGGAKMPSILNPNLPGGLEQIIMRAMAVDPAQRYSSATELLDDMEEFRKNPNILFYFDQPKSAREPAVTTPVAPTPPVQRPRRTQTETTTGSGRTRTGTSSRNTTQTRKPVRRPVEEEEEEEHGHGLAIALGVIGALVVITLVVLIVIVSSGKNTTASVEVPPLVGKVYENVKDSYSNLRLVDDEYKFSDDYPAGQIIEQDPKAHEVVPQGSVVHLVISNGPQTGQMLYLVNQPVDQAKNALESMTELRLQVITVEENNDFEAGRVFRTEPVMGETLRTGQQVVLYVSAGPVTADMPDVLDKTEAAAETILRNLDGMDLQLDFRTEPSEEIEKGHVTRTSPEKGATLKVGQMVIVYVSSGSAVVKTNVPNVVGLDISKAVSLLTEKKLKYDYEAVDSDLPKDQVISQDPGKNTEVAEGSTVFLTISKGPKETVPPTTEAPTEPPVVSRVVTLVLPSDITVSYNIQIYKSGSPITESLTIEPDSGTELKVSLEGRGIEYFDFYVNGSYVDVFRVNFDNTGAEKITLNFTVNG